MSFATYVLAVLQQVFAAYLPWVPFVGKYVSACLSALLQHHERRPSAAQLCNEDVLRGVFAELPPRTLASAALVCRSWLFPARDGLYHDLLVENTRSSERLADTLTANSSIRSLVRRLELRNSNTKEGGPMVFDWIALLPEHSLLSVEIGSTQPSREKLSSTLDSVLDFPAIRTTPHLLIYSQTFLTAERLGKVLRMANLESLSIHISLKAAVNLKDITAFPNLRRLSIVTEVYPPLVAKLVHGLPSLLERFDLLSTSIKPADLETLYRVLYRHAPRLRHLALFGEPISQLPSSFMDDFVSYCPALETLVCPDRLYSPRIISRLPPTLKALTLCTPGMEDPPLPISKYAIALRKHCAKLPQLRVVMIVDCQRSPPNYHSLNEVCKAELITLHKCSSVGIDLLRDTLLDTT